MQTFRNKTVRPSQTWSYRAGQGRWTQWDTCPGTPLSCKVWTSGRWRLDSPARTSWWWETPCCPQSSSRFHHCSSGNTHTGQNHNLMQWGIYFTALMPAWPLLCDTATILCARIIQMALSNEKVIKDNAQFFPSLWESSDSSHLESVSSPYQSALHLYVHFISRTFPNIQTGAFSSVSLNKRVVMCKTGWELRVKSKEHPTWQHLTLSW